MVRNGQFVGQEEPRTLPLVDNTLSDPWTLDIAETELLLHVLRQREEFAGR